MTNTLSPILQRQLTSDEIPLWSGQPIASRRALVGLWGTFFGIFFTGFALFFIVSSAIAIGTASSFLHMEPSSSFLDFKSFVTSTPQSLQNTKSFLNPISLFGLLFVIIGIWIMLLPLWNFIKARNTYYAITNKRIITLEGGIFGGFRSRSFRPSQMANIEKYERLNGSGSLYFASEFYRTTESVSGGTDIDNGDISIPVTRIRRIGFSEVSNVTDAEQALNHLLRI